MNRKQEKALIALYDRVPSANCKGLCQHECSIIGFSDVEGDFMRKHSHCTPTPKEDGFCNQLTADGKCRIYANRPIICRIWGTADDPRLKCPHGCEPDGGLLPIEEANEMLAESFRISGNLNCHVGHNHIEYK